MSTHNPARAAAEEILELTGFPAESIIARHYAPVMQVMEEMADALAPFANYACEPECPCHNCHARTTLANYRALTQPQNLISELTDAVDGRR